MLLTLDMTGHDEGKNSGCSLIRGFIQYGLVGTYFFFSELCWGKAMMAYTMPQQRKKEESEKLREERDQIKFIDLGFER